jgi:hypothetical protein
MRNKIEDRKMNWNRGKLQKKQREICIHVKNRVVTWREEDEVKGKLHKEQAEIYREKELTWGMIKEEKQGMKITAISTKGPK